MARVVPQTARIQMRYISKYFIIFAEACTCIYLPVIKSNREPNSEAQKQTRHPSSSKVLYQLHVHP